MLSLRRPVRLSRDATGTLVLDDDDRVLRVARGADRVLEVVAQLGGRAASEDLVRRLVRGPEDLPEVAGGVAQLILDDVLVRTGPEGPVGRTVVLTAVGDVDVAAVTESLAADGAVVVGQDAPGASLALVVCHDHLDERLVEVLQQHRERGLAVLLVRTGVTRCWVGPLLPPAPDGVPGGGVRPGAGAASGVCPACLDQQLRRNGTGPRPPTAGGATVVPATGRAGADRAAAALVATAVGAVLDDAPGVREAWQAQVRELRLHDLDVVHHPVAGCAQLARPAADDGTGGPEAFLDRVAPLVSALTGVLAPVTVRRAAGGQVLAETTHPVRRRDTGAPDGLGWTRAPAWGCRDTPAQARAAAVGEALERYCVSWHGDEAHDRASADELVARGEPVLLPQDLLLFSAGQRAAGEPVPDDLPADLRTDVSPLVSAVTGERWWVASAAVHFGHPDLRAARCCRPDSNGCAVGPTRPAAVLAGLLELVERDAVALWWWPRSARPGVGLDVLGPAQERRTIEAFGRTDRDVHLLDLTTDLGVPVVAAVSARSDGTGIVAGFGAAVDLAAAARRAVQECGQVLACLEFGVVGTGAPGWAQRSVRDEPYVLP
ncbi:hypothetical protein GTR02_20940, partial [Kineococcus sp. R8]|uniref:YcaO-like family protein n=1 Tax=Kineococcus siccus TaxID=2696567 RepID=UPI001412BD58|nr:hypothetical protein [Kineococcus siccus]